MKRILLMVSAVALLAGTTLASAQVRDWSGRNPDRSGVYGGYRAYPYSPYEAYGAYRYGPYDSYAYAPYRGYLRPDNPPGSRFQDRGIDEDNGVDPLTRGH